MHYEKYMRNVQKHRPMVKNLIADLLKNPDLAKSKGSWFDMLLTSKGFVPKTKHNKEMRLHAIEMDAFNIELLNLYFEEAEKKYGSYSLVNAIISSYDFVVFQSYLNQRVGIAPAQTVSELCYQMLSFERSGKKAYMVQPDLANKLKETEVRGLKTEDVFLPYGNIYICIPPELNFKIFNVETGWHSVIGAYIDEDKSARIQPPSLQVSAEPDGSIIPADKVRFEDRQVIRQWSIMFVGATNDNSKDSEDDALFYYRMIFYEGMSIDEIISMTTDRYASGGIGQLEGAGPEYDQMNNLWPVIFRWILNVIIYVTYKEAGEVFYENEASRKLIEKLKNAPKGSKKRKNIATTISQSELRKRILLGGNINVSRHTISQTRGPSDAARKVMVRTLVSGHWRRQPYGAQKTLRRMQWIEPFWKGPELGNNIVSKKHVLK